MDKNLEGLGEGGIDALLKGGNPTPVAPATPADQIDVPPAPVVPPAPAPTTPAPTTPAPAPTTPVVTTPVVSLTTPAPVVPPTPGTEPPATPPVVPPAPTGGIDLSKIENGRFKTEEELLAHLQNSNKLQQQLIELQNQSSFRSPGAKALFDLVNKIDGQPTDAVTRYLHVRSLDVEKLNGQQQRFESFMLDPQVMASGMSQSDLYAVFLEKDLEQYGDPSNPAIPRTQRQIFDENMATQKAKADLLKAKEELSNFGNVQQAPTKTPEQLVAEKIEYQNAVRPHLLHLNTINLSLKAKDGTGEELTGTVTIPLDQSQHERLVNMVVDPAEWWDNIMKKTGAMNEQGVIDPVKFGQLAQRFEFQEEREAAAFKQGLEVMMAKMVRTHVNPATPRTSGDAPPPATPEVKKSEKEKLAEGMFSMIGLR
jgi:hypothetical protein